MTDDKNNNPLNAEDLAGLDLKPDWAQSDKDKVSIVKGGASRGSRKPSSRDKGGKRSRGAKSANNKGERRGKPGRSDDARKRSGYSEKHRRPPARERTPRADSAVDLPLKISFIPERKGLGVVVRRIRNANKAFALPAIADLFLKKPEYYMVKVEALDKDFQLHECTLCSDIFRTESAAHAHIFEKHADHFFDIETVETEPPSGNFPFVARCGVTGELLAPPNHHTYRKRVQAVHDSNCPDMPMPKYEQRIQTTDDEEAIEQWKQQNAQTVQYRLKDQEDAAPMEKDAAQAYFNEHLARKSIKTNNRFVLPARAVWETTDPDLLKCFQEAWHKEKKFPLTLIHALRPALRHMKLNIFKVGQKATFVCAVQPAPIDPENSVSPIKEALDFIKHNPGCKRQELIEGLFGENPQNMADVEKTISSLHWLIDCGHVVEFADGALSVPVGKNRVEQ